MNKPMSSLTTNELLALEKAGYITVYESRPLHPLAVGSKHVLFMLHYTNPYKVGDIEMKMITWSVIPNDTVSSCAAIKLCRRRIIDGLVYLVNTDKRASFNELIWRLQNECN
jgi:hypothetical protein